MQDLPYLKFYVNEWLTGDISVEDYEVQGVFTIILSLYWSKQGKITETFIRKRFKDVPEIIERIFEAEIMKLDGEFIVINFCDEQMLDRNKLSKRNAENGRKGGRGNKKQTLEPTPIVEKKAVALDSLSEKKAKQSNKEEKRREEKRKEKNIFLKKDVAKAPKKQSNFIKPTIEEIKVYCEERKNGIDPETFFNHYDAVGWKRGNTQIKNWKACIITWEKRNHEKNTETAGLKITAYTYEQIIPKITSKECSFETWKPVQIGDNAKQVYVHISEIEQHNLQPFDFNKTKK